LVCPAETDEEKPFLQTIREQIDNGSLTGGAGGQQQLVGAAFALLAGTFGGALPSVVHYSMLYTFRLL